MVELLFVMFSFKKRIVVHTWQQWQPDFKLSLKNRDTRHDKFCLALQLKESNILVVTRLDHGEDHHGASTTCGIEELEYALFFKPFFLCARSKPYA